MAILEIRSGAAAEFISQPGAGRLSAGAGALSGANVFGSVKGTSEILVLEIAVAHSGWPLAETRVVQRHRAVAIFIMSALDHVGIAVNGGADLLPCRPNASVKAILVLEPTINACRRVNIRELPPRCVPHDIHFDSRQG